MLHFLILPASLFLVSIGFARSYSTDFPLTENPVSESGNWMNGATAGIDWGDVSTTAKETHPHPGPARYADATALLTGTWGPDHSAQGVVWTGNPNNYPEVEIRLRSSLSAHVCNGYEITFSIAPNSYLLIVRWNGPLGDYTVLSNPNGSQYQVKAGDTVKATVVGHVITAYKNGVQMGQAIDSVYTSGMPGMGFNEQENGDYGYVSFSATDGATTEIEPLRMKSPGPAKLRIYDMLGREVVPFSKDLRPAAMERSVNPILIPGVYATESNAGKSSQAQIWF